MSPYGGSAVELPTPTHPLYPRFYTLPKNAGFITVLPLVYAEIPDHVVDHLHALFNDIVRDGRTYPQEEELTRQQFVDYFFATDPLDDGVPLVTSPPISPGFLSHYLNSNVPLEEVIAGMYYIKPNYPGRSSHCCNGGFIVDPRWRGKRVGITLGKSYLYFAPRLGYKHSVFNLVYVSNVASIRVWDQLQFIPSGIIPKAGRLKTADGKGEEYVDAVVYWREFVSPYFEPKRQRELSGTTTSDVLNDSDTEEEVISESEADRRMGLTDMGRRREPSAESDLGTKLQGRSMNGLPTGEEMVRRQGLTEMGRIIRETTQPAAEEVTKMQALKDMGRIIKRLSV
ncbi:hypothetical protein BT69DRAFT_1375033 [Atractiella rhizophila]|nr:hypothetical protein BT69DRAFT_1375033 [Atractiella rhizophila]